MIETTCCRFARAAALAGLVSFSSGCGAAAVVFESAGARWQASGERQGAAAAPADLRLELTIEKAEAIRGESIRFEMTLTNSGNEPVTLDDGATQSRTFGVRVTGRGGFQAAGDPMSVAIREGERLEPPRQGAQKTLQPGDKIAIQGDLVAWAGELEPGDYSVTGSYVNSPALRAESKKVPLRVTQAAPVYARSARQNLFLGQQPRETTWINRAGTGFTLFLLQSSPKNPTVSYSNRPIASLASAEEAVPSSYNVAPPKVQQVVWVSPEGSLQIVRLPQGGDPEEPVAVPLPDKALRVVETPYTDEEGNLDLVLAAADGKSAGLFQVPVKGTPSYFQIEVSPPLSAQRSVQWYKDGVFVLAWLSPDGKEVFAASSELAALPGRIAPKKIFTSPFAIADLALTQRYNQTRQMYDRLLVILGVDRARETLMVKRLDIRTGNIESDERFVVAGLKGMSFFKSALREDMTPVYSFFDSDGGLWVAQPRLGRLTPVSDSAGVPVSKESFPELVLPSRSSKLPGIYVRYIEGGKRLAVLKVG